MTREFYFPYLLDYSHLVVEDVVVFAIAVLVAIVVSAEGQAFASTFLGDSRPGAKDRFHFNVFLHMSILGTLNFFVAGFGWAKKIDIDVTKFKKHPRLYLVISRLAGPVANLMMANIAASMSWILGNFGFEDKVFSAMVVVNVTMAIYGLLLVPPLPGSALLFSIFPDNETFRKGRELLCKVGPSLILVAFICIRYSGWDGLSNLFSPVVQTVTTFVLDI